MSKFTNHGFFGRKYGESSGLYSSLNCSKFVGDRETLVLKNLDIVKNKLQSLRIITLQQQHGNLCIVVNQQTNSDMKADAMVAKTVNISIGVLTADCAPILFLDKRNHIIGAAHAGWKGAVSGIIESTIDKMVELGSNPKDISAAIGPCISQENYEVDEAFKKSFNGNEDYFCVINFKVHFDLPKYCENRLLKSGLCKSNIDVIKIDTYSERENYFSYRFASKNSNGICGRQISAICLR
ncbi:MAG: peptidoglycan editing factor PgeF [Holosporaceae bacterium]|jgi:YfiH family protein|nr:peptidoglycan editing factor PgeF [Holosporaceae bacterium]